MSSWDTAPPSFFVPRSGPSPCLLFTLPFPRFLWVGTAASWWRLLCGVLVAFTQTCHRVTWGLAPQESPQGRGFPGVGVGVCFSFFPFIYLSNSEYLPALSLTISHSETSHSALASAVALAAGTRSA